MSQFYRYLWSFFPAFWSQIAMKKIFICGSLWRHIFTIRYEIIQNSDTNKYYYLLINHFVDKYNGNHMFTYFFEYFSAIFFCHRYAYIWEFLKNFLWDISLSKKIKKSKKRIYLNAPYFYPPAPQPFYVQRHSAPFEECEQTWANILCPVVALMSPAWIDVFSDLL